MLKPKDLDDSRDILDKLVYYFDGIEPTSKNCFDDAIKTIITEKLNTLDIRDKQLFLSHLNKGCLMNLLMNDIHKLISKEKYPLFIERSRKICCDLSREIGDELALIGSITADKHKQIQDFVIEILGYGKISELTIKNKINEFLIDTPEYKKEKLLNFLIIQFNSILGTKHNIYYDFFKTNPIFIQVEIVIDCIKEIIGNNAISRNFNQQKLFS